jgi:hypothetical protein
MMCERRLREIRLDTHPNAAALSTQLWRISMPVHNCGTKLNISNPLIFIPHD